MRSNLLQRIPHRPITDPCRFIFVFLPLFLIYLKTLAPTVYNLDSAELTTAAATLGITRATGYPLYTLLGHLWCQIPIGDAGFRMNLFSAVCGALTVAVLDQFLKRLGLGTWSRLGGLGLLAFGNFFWSFSLIAEVYTLHTLFIACLLWVLVSLNEDSSTKNLALCGLVLGLSLSHHAATVLLLPGIAFYLFRGARKPSPSIPISLRQAACVLLPFLLGVSLYLYLPLRYLARPAFNYAGHYAASGIFVPQDLTTIQGFIWLVSGASFSSAMLGYAPSDFLSSGLAFILQLAREFFLIGIGPGILGVWVLFRRDRGLGISLMLMFLCHSLFFIGYAIPDKATMFLPSFVFWAIWIAFGIDQVFHWLSSADVKRPSPLIRWANTACKTLILAGVCLSLAWNWHFVDKSHDWSSQQKAQELLSTIEPQAVVLGYWDTIPLIQYHQLVEHRRDDIQTINLYLMSSSDRDTFLYTKAGKRTLYLDTRPESLGLDLPYQSAGSLYKIIPPR